MLKKTLASRSTFSARLPAVASAKSWRISDFQDDIIGQQRRHRRRDRDGSRSSLWANGTGFIARFPSNIPARTARITSSFSTSSSVTDGDGEQAEVRVLDLERLARSEDLHSRRGRYDAHGRDHLRRPQRNALLRGLRRVLLERDRQRLAGADRSRVRRRYTSRTPLQARCGRRPSLASTARRSATQSPTVNGADG